ncbi:MAG: L-lactate dehydrogenase, partial [Clostridia bacterium]|nr:L-lactate dehydrogenase [Clostridia bacterium]
YVFHKVSGIPESRIIGSGTILDTARLRSRISEYYGVNQKNVHAYVLGEHGDSSFVPWSIANISNVPVEQYKNAVVSSQILPEFNREEVENYMRKSGGRVIQRKGATFYAVSMSVCHICKCLISGIDTTMTVSTMMHGEYGIEDVCLSVLNIVGEKGVSTKVLLPLNDEEIKALQHSANCLKEIINNIEI